MLPLNKIAIVFIILLSLVLTLFPIVDWVPTQGDIYWGSSSEQVPLKRFDFIFNSNIQELIYKEIPKTKITFSKSELDAMFYNESYSVQSVVENDTLDDVKNDSLSLIAAYHYLLNNPIEHNPSKNKLVYDFAISVGGFGKADFAKSYDSFINYLSESPTKVKTLYDVMYSGSKYWKSLFGSTFIDFLELGFDINSSSFLQFTPVTRKVYNIKYIHKYSDNFSRSINVIFQLLGYFLILLIGLLISILLTKQFQSIKSQNPPPADYISS